jgi:hypothetical protein
MGEPCRVNQNETELQVQLKNAYQSHKWYDGSRQDWVNLLWFEQ